MSSSFKIIFHCGKEIDFPDCFWNVFQVSPREDPEKAKQISHYFPLRFEDFAILLYRTKEIEQSEVDIKINPVYSTLCKFVKTVSFQESLSDHQAETLSEEAEKDQASSNYPKDLHKQNEARFKSYAKLWYDNNHLYPFIDKRDLIAEKDCDGGPCPCGKHRIKENKSDELTLELPQITYFSCSDDLLNKFPDSHSLSLTIKMTELKWSLFSELHLCPYIYLQTCLVINLKSRFSIVKGYLSEKSGSYGESFLDFATFSGNYGTFLKELINIAKAIYFTHQHNYIIRMNWENIVAITNDHG